MSEEGKTAGDTMRYVSELAGMEGGRGAGTEGEAKAARLIHNWMEEAGFDTRLEKFPVMPSGFHMGFVHFFFLGSIAYMLPIFGISVVVSFVYMLGLCTLIAGEYATFITLSRRIARIGKFPDSANVIGEAGSADSSKTIVLTAHLDSQKSSLFTEAIAKWGPIPWYNVVFFFAMLPFVLFPYKIVWASTAAIFFLFAAFFLYCDLTGKYTPGASDNASGVAGILLAGRELASDEKVASDARIILVATGAEETGMWGMYDFIKKHGKDLDKENTLVINLDNIGAGSLKLLEWDVVESYRYKRRDLKPAIKVAAEHGVDLELTSHFLPTDGIVALRNGFKTLSFVAKDDKGKILNYHIQTDIAEHVDQNVVETAAKIAADVARRFLHSLDA